MSSDDYMRAHVDEAILEEPNGKMPNSQPLLFGVVPDCPIQVVCKAYLCSSAGTRVCRAKFMCKTVGCGSWLCDFHSKVVQNSAKSTKLEEGQQHVCEDCKSEADRWSQIAAYRTGSTS